MDKTDLSGDGRSDLLVTSPWGLGVVGWDGHGLRATTMCANGTSVGQWRLDTSTNRAQLLGDFDGDGRSEVLLSSPWGIGVASFARALVPLAGFPGGPTTRAMAANGSRVGGWAVDTSRDRFVHAADVDGDGRSEIVVTSPWGLGALALRDGALTSMGLAANGTRLGEWLLDTAVDGIPAVGDVDGDGRAELVVTSPWGLGILRLDGAGFRSIAMAPNGTRIGARTLDTTVDRVEVVADLDGDGRAEIVVSGPQGLSVVAVSGSTLISKAFVADGAAAGEWRVESARTAFLAADVDGDGRHELIVTSPWGLGVLGLGQGGLASRLMLANGARPGGWTVDTRENRFGPALDIDGDGREELLVTSRWGLGMLRLGGPSADVLVGAQNGTGLGDWRLATADDDWLSGRRHAHAVILHHPDWSDAVAQTEHVLTARGYAVDDTGSAADGTAMVRRLAQAARPGDRAFVYLAGHGDSKRTSTGDHTVERAPDHEIQFEDGSLAIRDLLPSFSLLAAKGVELAVVDGSCDGGETVLAATGERYLAIATTGVYSPGKTNAPSPGDVLKQFGQPATYGMWWSASDAVSRMTGEGPHLFYEKMFRNDDTEIARWSLFYRTGINFLGEMGYAWDLMARRCYLYEHIYPEIAGDPTSEGFDDYRAAAKIGAADYVASMQADHDGFAPTIATLLRLLADDAAVGRAAEVYAAAYPRPWLTTTGYLDWNTFLSPTRTVDGDTVWLTPPDWVGTAGYRALVAECVRRIHDLDASWARQRARLIRLDEKLAIRMAPHAPIDPALIRWTATRDDQRRRGDFDALEAERTATLLAQLPQTPVHADPEVRRPPVIRDARVAPAAGRLGVVAERPPVTVLDEAAVPVAPHPAPPAPAALHEALSAARLDMTAVGSALATSIAGLITPLLPDRTVAELIADIRAEDLAGQLSRIQLRYYLMIVEEALSRVAENGAQPGDLVSF